MRQSFLARRRDERSGKKKARESDLNVAFVASLREAAFLV
jgi:hypothetical protein